MTASSIFVITGIIGVILILLKAANERWRLFNRVYTCGADTFAHRINEEININFYNLLNNDLNYPDDIGGEYYFNLSDKEKKKYKLTNPEFLLKHFDYRKIFDLNINEQI